MQTIKVSTGIPATVQTTVQKDGSLTRIRYDVEWKAEDLHKGINNEITLEWSKPLIDMQYQWHTNIGTNRALIADWYAPLVSKISNGAPLHCFYNDAGMNRYTIALDACLTGVARAFGVREENAELKCRVVVPLDESGLTTADSFTLWIDETDCRYEEAIRRVANWWEEKYPPMPVPAAAKNPMYSCWYSLHQDVYEKDVLAECEKAAALGMETVIIDDGWQTDDNHRGYGFCGDWEVCTKKIPDMHALVEKIHAIGMKVMIWYSVPFLGKFSKNAERFSSMTLEYYDEHNAWTLDPRYPEVRAFLINTYVEAVRNWDLDGLKLDFIDSFRMGPDTPVYRDGMDYAVLEEAVHRLMVDVMKSVREVRSDILIEFRQRYIGPAMREFGNMFRVADCPSSTSTNRIGMVDLRLTSGGTAVHTDMLMWHAQDRVENAVCQIENGLFATVQFSAKLADMSEDHLKAIRFWSAFMTEEQELLQEAPIWAENPQMLYPVVHTEKDGRGVWACYQQNMMIDLPASRLRDIWVINANSGAELLIRADREKEYSLSVMNCMGEIVSTQDILLKELSVIQVPECGLIRLTAID